MALVESLADPSEPSPVASMTPGVNDTEEPRQDISPKLFMPAFGALRRVSLSCDTLDSFGDGLTASAAVATVLSRSGQTVDFLDLSKSGLNDLELDWEEWRSVDWGSLKLKVVDLSRNNLSRIPTWIHWLPRLRSLDLGHNLNLGDEAFAPENLPDRFGRKYNRSITKLSLEGCGLREFPQAICHLRDLYSLSLSGNRGPFSEGLPAALTGLARLRLLRLRGLGLAELPRGFENLENLNTLDLAGNNFQEFPCLLLALPNLTLLDLSSNQIGFLPNDISGMSSLRELLIARNHLDCLPLSPAPKSLRLVDAYKNVISEVPTPAFCSGLAGLDLAGNKVGAIELERVEGMESYRELEKGLRRKLGVEGREPCRTNAPIRDEELENIEEADDAVVSWGLATIGDEWNGHADSGSLPDAEVQHDEERWQTTPVEEKFHWFSFVPGDSHPQLMATRFIPPSNRFLQEGFNYAEIFEDAED